MAPAISLAEEGFVLTQGDADILAGGTKAFAAEPNVAAIFLNGGKPWQAGERLVQKNLAATLRAIARDGTGRLLQGADRRRGRGGERCQWRHSHARRISPTTPSPNRAGALFAIAATTSSRRRRRARAARPSARSSTSSRAIR